MSLLQIIDIITKTSIIIFAACLITLIVISISMAFNYGDDAKLTKLAIIVGVLSVLTIIPIVSINAYSQENVWFNDKYDVYAMADQYHATRLMCDRNSSDQPYIVHYEGFGREQWVLYEPEPDPQAQFSRMEDE